MCVCVCVCVCIIYIYISSSSSSSHADNTHFLTIRPIKPLLLAGPLDCI